MSTAQVSPKADKRIYQGLSLQQNKLPKSEEQWQRLQNIPPPPPWRTFGIAPDEWHQAANSQSVDVSKAVDSDPRSLGFVASEKATQIVNAALCLRRPILIEG